MAAHPALTARPGRPQPQYPKRRRPRTGFRAASPRLGIGGGQGCPANPSFGAARGGGTVRASRAERSGSSLPLAPASSISGSGVLAQCLWSPPPPSARVVALAQDCPFLRGSETASRPRLSPRICRRRRALPKTLERSFQPPAQPVAAPRPPAFLRCCPRRRPRPSAPGRVPRGPGEPLGATPRPAAP